MSKNIFRISIGIISVVLLVVAFAGVMSNQKARTNRVIDKVDLNTTDHYMTEEVIRTWYGQIGITNVEEFGTNDGQVAAIIHYKNSTDSTLALGVDDLGTFMDEDYNYTIYGDNTGVVEYEPDDTAEFSVYIKRDEGLNGLSYLLAEPEEQTGTESGLDTVYQASIDFNMLNTDDDEKVGHYGITGDYTEKEQEDSVGRVPEQIETMDTVDDIILHVGTDKDVSAQVEEARKQREEKRQKALDYLSSNQDVQGDNQ